jgi:uncharacterized protein YndB with AHSA1/START domain
MDDDQMLRHPIEAVFGHLAAPARLGDWLPGATRIQAPDGAAAFTLRLRRGDGTQIAATGELIAYEPPWLVAYRLRAGPDTNVLRITCTATGAGTRVHVRQAGPAGPVTVDLARLRQAITARPPHDTAPAAPGPGPPSGPAQAADRDDRSPSAPAPAGRAVPKGKHR